MSGLDNVMTCFSIYTQPAVCSNCQSLHTARFFYGQWRMDVHSIHGKECNGSGSVPETMNISIVVEYTQLNKNTCSPFVLQWMGSWICTLNGYNKKGRVIPGICEAIIDMINNGGEYLLDDWSCYVTRGNEEAFLHF